MYDIVIKNGLIVDGSGMPGYRSDLGVKDGRIEFVGQISADEAQQVIDASGKAVAPGFIDPHTHFDAQLLWDGEARPALAHGVTTIVPGNCSLSLAPLKAAHRDGLVGMFRQIEELPKETFDGTAFEWTWETFDGYLAAIRDQLSINVAPLVGHSVIRMWVMGEAAQQRAADADEIAAMQDLLRQCLQAGAVGLSTSYVDIDANLYPVPSRWAHADELDALAAVLGEFGRMLQVVPEFYATDITIARIDQLADLSLKYNIPTTFSPLFDSSATPDNVPRAMARVREQMARGARVWPQVQTRPIDISFCFDLPSLFFATNPTWFQVMRLEREAKLAALTNGDSRAKLIEAAGPDGGNNWLGGLVIRSVPDGDNENIEGKTVAEVAAVRGQAAAECMIELSLQHNLDVHFLAANMGHNDSQRVGPLLADPAVHVGASDGGAHIASFATYGDTGYLFSEFVRGEGSLTLEAAVKKITHDTANIWGITDRGLLQPGFAADVVVFDPDTIARDTERAVRDIPGTGMRYVRDAIGVDAVLVNGQLAYDQDGYKEAHAGQVVSGQV
ncbi:MAG: amidohydrolase family protein, partial [Pseudomonadota bacterium]